MNLVTIHKLAEDAGAKIFNEPLGKGIRIVIADNNASGDGTYFVPLFARLIEQHLKEDHEVEEDHNE